MSKKKETKKEKKVASGERKLYMLECISIQKIRYCVETDKAGLKKIQDRDLDCDYTEFSQDHVTERVIAIHPIDKETYLKMFNEDNDYLSSWTDDKKLEFINKK